MYKLINVFIRSNATLLVDPQRQPNMCCGPDTLCPDHIEVAPADWLDEQKGAMLVPVEDLL